MAIPRLCSVEDCGKPVASRGWCNGHYRRWRMHGDPTKGKSRPIRPERCEIEGCDRKHAGHGFCATHLYHFRKHGHPLAGAFHDNAPMAFLVEASGTELDECIPWPFCKGGKGYAQVSIGGNQMGWAHRMVCEMVHGEAPTDTHHAAHRCGRMDCVNPRHLRWATPKENEADKVLHGRTNRGSRQWRSKLTPATVRTIREEAKSLTQSEIADRHNVKRQTIGDVLSGRNWAWLP